MRIEIVNPEKTWPWLFLGEKLDGRIGNSFSATFWKMELSMLLTLAHVVVMRLKTLVQLKSPIQNESADRGRCRVTLFLEYFGKCTRRWVQPLAVVPHAVSEWIKARHHRRVTGQCEWG
jgi:hypothetical protein